MVITATEKEGNRQLYVYNITPFNKRTVAIGLGEKGFDGSLNETTGSFSIAIDNLFKDIKAEDLDKYDWHVKVSNMSKNNSITYSNLKLLDENQNVLYSAPQTDYAITSEQFIKLEKVS